MFVPQQIPYDPVDFTGRADEKHQISRLSRAADGDGVVISVIDGMAGVGKTKSRI